ncbi:helix-turn-helix transcriptional regulator [Streptomyces sasae]|uniref:hypothetical protein n=1 Tax=Streptomyces sasae TaxID=1266772 RepID=UPI0037423344
MSSVRWAGRDRHGPGPPRRLEGARRELDRPGSPYAVAGVAARWQFADVGYFRRACRAAYGHAPGRRGAEET